MGASLPAKLGPLDKREVQDGAKALPERPSCKLKIFYSPQHPGCKITSSDSLIRRGLVFLAN